MNTVVRTLVSMLCGLLIGILVSFTVTQALLEISISAFFSICLGLGLFAMGIVIMIRVLSQNIQKRTSISKYFVVSFASLVVISGVCCFFLEKQWFASLSPTMKVPMYMLLGIALAFAVTFSIVDLINTASTWASGAHAYHRPVVGTSAQICVVLLAAIIDGAYLGILFGTFDVEDDSGSGSRIKKDEYFSLPAGGVVGLLVGLVNSLCTKTGYEYDPLDVE